MPTPADAAPHDVQRSRLVEEAMASLDGVEELPIDAQLVQLGQAQDLLSGVLHNADVSQLRIPGVG